MHAVVEDNLPQIFPAHYAEIIVISTHLLRAICSSHLQTLASYLMGCAVFICLQHTQPA